MPIKLSDWLGGAYKIVKLVPGAMLSELKMHTVFYGDPT